MAPTATVSVVEETLTRYRAFVLPALVEDLPEHSPSYLYDLLPIYPSRPGKGLRAALTLATCAALGGDIHLALNSAVAVELFHNAFLIHDDIQDASDNRRGGPTLHSLYGPAIALNVGNATNLLALQRIRANRAILGGSLAWQVFEETETMLRHSLEGQAIELGWIRDNTTGLVDDDYYRMCLKKTSWYTCIYPGRLGLLIARGSATDLSVLDRFGWYLGAAFQIQDDVLNLVGDYDEYGKEIGGDLLEGKRTLMMIHLQRVLTGPDGDRLAAYLARSRAERTEDEAAWVFERMRELGCVEAAQLSATDLAQGARAEAERVLADAAAGPDRDFLLGLPDYVVTRTR